MTELVHEGIQSQRPDLINPGLTHPDWTTIFNHGRWNLLAPERVRLHCCRVFHVEMPTTKLRRDFVVSPIERENDVKTIVRHLARRSGLNGGLFTFSFRLGLEMERNWNQHLRRLLDSPLLSAITLLRLHNSAINDPFKAQLVDDSARFIFACTTGLYGTFRRSTMVAFATISKLLA